MFSLIIPVYNESQLIDDLVARVVAAVKTFAGDYELLFVDDGSTDTTVEQLLKHRLQNKKIKIISLSKNFGHQAAFTAGLEHATGDIVAMMDGDLQDPPELLAEMYAKITKEGYDIVSGKRTGRKGKNHRTFYTFLFHLLFKNIGGLENMENAGNFSMMTREALQALLSLKEKVRYMPGLRSFIGFNQGTVDYIRDDRAHGEPKMSLSKLFALATDAIFSFSRFPIRLCLWLGSVGTIVFLLAGIYVLVEKILGLAVLGWSSTLLSIYFLGSIQLIFLGIVGEYVFRIYKESQNRPIYFIRKIHEEETKV
ncbi:MAG: glycosyltransferase family 2 protein [Prolixibacteraceae bacterium]|jgi:dolichol-phosphate mannosyltransferase|nr:glycosyltransferase family 2 protein [Prolixibacteraceae bacterium]